MDAAPHSTHADTRAVARTHALRETSAQLRERARRMLDGHRTHRPRATGDTPPATDPELRWLAPTLPGGPAAEAFAVELDGSTPPAVTLRVRGEVDLATGPRVDALLRAHLDELPAMPLRVDLAAVTFISAGALRRLLGAVRGAQRRGLPVDVVAHSPAVLRLLAIVESGADRARPACGPPG